MQNMLKYTNHITYSTQLSWAETRHYWRPELVWVWIINLKWCTDELTLFWHSLPCWRTRWTNHITRRGPCLTLQDIPSGLPADKTSDRHSSHLVQRKGKTASIQSSAGGSTGYITACSPAQHSSVLWKGLDTSHLISSMPMQLVWW